MCAVEPESFDSCPEEEIEKFVNSGLSLFCCRGRGGVSSSGFAVKHVAARFRLGMKGGDCYRLPTFRFADLAALTSLFCGGRVPARREKKMRR